MSAQQVSIVGSEMHAMESQATGRSYRINVSLPLGYFAEAGEAWPFNRIPEKWPVIYLVDGNQYFGMVTDMIRTMSWCGQTNDAMVVAIGYPESSDAIATFRDYFTRRNADLTPVREPAEEEGMEKFHKRPTPSGDSANFLRFLQEELIPFIEREYHADPARRTLMGHSYGGLFGVFALLNAPGLFTNLVIGSPTLAYGNRYTFQLEESFAKQGGKLSGNVYLYATEDEEAHDDSTLSDTIRFAAILQGRKYEGLTLVKKIFADQNHCAVAAPGFHWGLKGALKK